MDDFRESQSSQVPCESCSATGGSICSVTGSEGVAAKAERTAPVSSGSLINASTAVAAEASEAKMMGRDS